MNSSLITDTLLAIWRERDRPESVVYFARNPGSQTVKVGFTANLDQRLATLRTAIPDLELVGAIPGGRRAERDLHDHLAASRIAGEWFAPTPLVAQTLAALAHLNLWPDPLLDVVVTLGKGRRKAWRHVNADDLAAMVDLRKQNTNSARRAERRFIKDVTTVYDELVAAGTVGEMVARNRAASLAESA